MAIKKLKPVSLSVYMFDDLLSLLDDEHARKAEELLTSSDISFGDAEYTLVRGHIIERLLYQAYDEVHDDVDQSSEKFAKARSKAMAAVPSLLPDINGEPRLVAISG
jgi:hypothetical protein